MSDSPPLPDQQLIRRSDLNRLARPALGLPDSINLINRIDRLRATPGADAPAAVVMGRSVLFSMGELRAWLARLKGG